MAQTVAEKIISSHAHAEVRPDDLVIAHIDGAMASDTTAPLAIKAFREMGGERVWSPESCHLVIDHASPAPNERIANLHQMMRAFAHEQKCRLFESGEGICHQLMVEHRTVKPGDIFLGADSHTCTYGAVGALGIGVGSTDLAAAWLTGKTWLRVPHTIRIRIHGALSPGVYGKDLALTIVGKLGISGATYQALEFSGSCVEHLSLSDRMTLANMAIETGAKTAYVHPRGLAEALIHAAVLPDEDAACLDEIELDAAKIPPLISLPHSPANALPVDDHAGKKIDYAFIGTCVNGRLEDLHAAAQILDGGKVHSDVRLVIGPASRRVFLDALMDGTVETLTQAGATFISPGCGPCVGTHNGIPGDGECVISVGNRNFKGRMGNPNAAIYLASPATVAASAKEGCIANPVKYFKGIRAGK